MNMNGFFVGLALALLLWFAAFFILRAYVRRRTSPDYILELLQEEVRQLEADIDEKTEQDLQLLEEKMRALREICSEAERRIAVYNRELEKRDSEEKAITAIAKKPVKSHTQESPAKAEQKQPMPVQYEIKPINITLAHEKLTIKPRPVRERIAELQKAGFSPELIAKRLKLNPGEVQLYFNLADKPE